MVSDSPAGGRRLVLDEGELRARLAEIQAERARLDARERAIIGALDLFENGIVDGGSGSPGMEGPASSSVPSQREMIRQVLGGGEAPELSVSEIIQAIAERFGSALPRTSISPTLAKLEAAGEVDHVGRKWRLSDGNLFEPELTPAP